MDNKRGPGTAMPFGFRPVAPLKCGCAWRKILGVETDALTIARRPFFRAESQIVFERLSPHAISGDGLFAVHERIRDVEEHGKSCLAENLEAIASINAEGRQNW